MSGSARPPRGAWLQVTGAVLLVPLALVLGAVFAWDAVQQSGQSRAYADAAGRTAVLDAELDDVDVSPLVPMAEGVYRVQVPADAPVPEAGGEALVRVDQRWGFPPSEDHEQRLQVLVTWVDEPVDAVSARNLRVLEWAPASSPRLLEVTPARAEELRDAARSAWLVTGAVVLGLLAAFVALVVRAVQRSRRRRSWVRAHAVPPVGCGADAHASGPRTSRASASSARPSSTRSSCRSS